MKAFALHFHSKGGLPWGESSHEDSGEAKLFVEGIIQAHPRIGEPVFAGVAGACDKGDAGRGQIFKKILLPGQLVGPGAEIPFDRFRVDADDIKKLEKMVLHMAERAGSDLGIGGEPVELAGSGPIETDFDRSLTKGGEQGGFEVALQIENKIKRALGKVYPHFNKSSQPCFTLEDKNLIHGWVALDQGGPCLLEEPGDMSFGAMAFDGANQG